MSWRLRNLPRRVWCWAFGHRFGVLEFEHFAARGTLAIQCQRCRIILQWRVPPMRRAP